MSTSGQASRGSPAALSGTPVWKRFRACSCFLACLEALAQRSCAPRSPATAPSGAAPRHPSWRRPAYAANSSGYGARRGWPGHACARGRAGEAELTPQVAGAVFRRSVCQPRRLLKPRLSRRAGPCRSLWRRRLPSVVRAGARPVAGALCAAAPSPATAIPEIEPGPPSDRRRRSCRAGGCFDGAFASHRASRGRGAASELASACLSGKSLWLRFFTVPLHRRACAAEADVGVNGTCCCDGSGGSDGGVSDGAQLSSGISPVLAALVRKPLRGSRSTRATRGGDFASHQAEAAELVQGAPSGDDACRGWPGPVQMRRPSAQVRTPVAFLFSGQNSLTVLRRWHSRKGGRDRRVPQRCVAGPSPATALLSQGRQAGAGGAHLGQPGASAARSPATAPRTGLPTGPPTGRLTGLPTDCRVGRRLGCRLGR